MGHAMALPRLLLLLGVAMVSRAQVALQGDGKFSYHFVVPNPESVLTCENMNFKAVEDLQKTVKNLTEMVARLNTSTGGVYRGGFPVATSPPTDAKMKCECSCNAKVDFHFEYRDCQDVKELSPLTLSGVYKVYPITRVEHLLVTNSSTKVKGKYWSVKTEDPMAVYCELSSSREYGWTVLQRRVNFDVDFNRSWTEYKEGFGDMKGDFWLGLDKMHAITNQKFLVYLMRITMWPSTDIPIHRDYKLFKIGNEASNYTLRFQGAGVGALNTYIDQMNGGVFTTYDRDNDGYKGKNCAINGYKYTDGGGWWFKTYSSSYYCGMSNLNAFKPHLHSLAPVRVEMKIRPLNA